MTTQPERPYATDDEYEEDMGRTTSSAAAGEYGDEQAAVIVAEVIDEEPVLAADDEATPASSTATNGTDSEPNGRAGAPGNGVPGQQWHDIQAMFVDDPRGSVQLAAQAADAAVNSLVESLRERQTGLWPGAGTADGPNPSDTEQLRETLRQYRMFCEAVRDLGGRLPQARGR